ncbi:putative Ig domain-containing protein [Deinococcus yavapaiensis]|uniref:Uncharacterized protein n=1 Tax=Deinococcus yavapaiensis KR-236 TaxID=694435 RepID=A0A318S715_9DEIO|nr:putative Ig domain-containing protein [Deinococcus yavapaiensis]PYE54766.1 hypothetical protein DES52_10436 [Deinococcus yavapaiensis KR-236]
MSHSVAPARFFLTLLLGASLASCGTNSTFGSGTTSSKEILSFRSSTLPDAYANEPYSTTVALSGGVNPYSVRVTNGTLPPGVRLSGTALTGTPTQTGRYEFTLEAADATLSTKSQTLTINVATLPPVALTPILGASSAANTTFRSDTRVPLRVTAPRGARAMRLSWRLPSGVEVARVQPGDGTPLLLWKQSPGLLTVVLGFPKEPVSGANVAVVSLRFAGPTQLDGTQVGLEARDATGKKIVETALPAPKPPASATPSGSATPTTSPSTTPAANASTPAAAPSLPSPNAPVSNPTKVPDTTSAPGDAPSATAPATPPAEGAAEATPPSEQAASTPGATPPASTPTSTPSSTSASNEPSPPSTSAQTGTADAAPASTASAPESEKATGDTSAQTPPTSPATSPTEATQPTAPSTASPVTPPTESAAQSSGTNGDAPASGATSTPTTTPTATPTPTAPTPPAGPDLGDFAILAVNYGRTGQNLPGDLNKDGKVDAADVRLFSERYPLP